MAQRRQIERNGKIWSVVKVSRGESEQEDFRFWYDGLTAEERVDSVAGALESCLKARGDDGVPRLRRVHRRIRRPWGPAPDHQRTTDRRPS